MKLLNIATARAIWLFSVNDLNPRGQALRQESFNAVAERYQFQSVPTPAFAIEAQKKNEPVPFVAGAFPSASGPIVAVDLRVYNDGIIADTRSNTKDSDGFLEDFFSWLPEGIGLPRTDVLIRKKLYVSEMYVESDYQLAMINPKLSKLSKSLASLVPKGSATSYEISTLGFSTDPKDGAPLTNFRFERQINVAFDQCRYFSSAPVHTDDHFKLLEDLEETLRG